MGRIQDFGAHTVRGHLGDSLVFVLSASGRIVGSLPAIIRSTVLKRFW
jgi:hypothetical protein